MPIYSHSQLSVYEQCPLKYKLHYIDKIKREEAQGIEAFRGDMVHRTLKKCYDDLKYTRLNTLNDLISNYDNLWKQNWNDAIAIMKKDLTQGITGLLERRCLRAIIKDMLPLTRIKQSARRCF